MLRRWAFLDQLEVRHKAERRATRRVLRSLEGVAAARTQRNEGVECLGSMTAEEHNAAGFAQAMDLDEEFSSAPADSDSESEAIGGGPAGVFEEVDFSMSDLSQSSTESSE